MGLALDAVACGALVGGARQCGRRVELLSHRLAAEQRADGRGARLGMLGPQPLPLALRGPCGVGAGSRAPPRRRGDGDAAAAQSLAGYGGGRQRFDEREAERCRLRGRALRHVVQLAHRLAQQ